MKNRNKRITSVLAASMALGTFAPVIASVAPVFAAETSEKYPTLTNNVITSNNLIWTVTPKQGGNGYDATLTGKTSDFDATSLNIGPTVTLQTNKVDGGNVITPTVVAIKDHVFNGNDTLKNVSINGDDVVIGLGAFANIDSLETVTLNNVDTIGIKAFKGSENLANVTLGDGLTTIAAGAFWYTGIKTVTIPNSVETIGPKAFADTNLTGEIALPANLTSIGGEAFATEANSLSLVYPQINGENSKLSIKWATDDGAISLGSSNAATTSGVFGSNVYSASNQAATKKLFNIKGSSSTAPDSISKADKPYYLSQPTITVDAKNLAKPVSNKNVEVVLGQNVTITTAGKGILSVDGDEIEYVSTGKHNYNWVTPQVGTHTVTFTNEYGISRSITVTVVAEGENYWLDANITIPEWHLGADVTPSGAVAKYGDVIYVYSATEDGTYYTNKPNSEGTWWVKAIVKPTANYAGIETAPQSFTVLAPLAKQGWENTAAGWTYYVDGEQVKSELITVDGRKYLIGDNGIMVKGWAKNDQTGNEWMFFDNYGCQKTGWLSNDGRWYFFNEDGVMQANEWVTDKGKSYFLTQSGGMAASRWLKKDGHDVYVDNSGALKTGWLFDINYMAWYYLEPDTGYMATSGTVDGWTIQANGQAVQK